jgi:glucose-6-phosphate 1-dehydrogenase
MLEVVALLTMEAPIGRDAEALRYEKQRAFRAMRPLSPADIVRGQSRGYRSERGVARDSRVETFAVLKPYVDTWRWAGVPFYRGRSCREKRWPASESSLLSGSR